MFEHGLPGESFIFGTLTAQQGMTKLWHALRQYKICGIQLNVLTQRSVYIDHNGRRPA